MEVTPSGMISVVREEQPEKVLRSMEVTEGEMATEAREEQPEKA